MGLLQLLPILTLTAYCHGAALPQDELALESLVDIFQDFVADPSPYMESFGIRAKRHVENHSGFKEFPLPFLGGEIGVKYKDANDRAKGGEAFLHIEDLQSVIPAAHSKMVKVHVIFDGGASSGDGLFTLDVDYHLEHKDGDGVEEGKLKVVRELRGGKWHTNIKTSTTPFSGVPIIPARLANLDFELESDRRTMLKGKYVNPTADRDITVDVVRVPGKSILINTSNKGRKSVIKVTMTKPSAQEVDIDIAADIRGTKLTGKISGKIEAGKSTKLKVDLKKGSEIILQLQTEVKMTGNKGKFRGKYSIMGGKVAQGAFTGKYDKGKFEFEAKPYKLAVDVKLGESLKVVASTNGVEMWSYKSLRENKSTANAIIYEAKSDMTMNPASKLYKFIQAEYPFGAFETRSNTIKLYVDKNNRNLILRKFKFDFEVIKDGAKVVDVLADTTASPYKFVFNAPNFLRKLGLSQDDVSLTINHQRGTSLIVEANIAGGLKLDISHTPNGLGGRTINVIATKGAVQMWKYNADTSKVNNNAILKVGLKGTFELNPASLLYKKIVTKYRLLTPFTKRTSDLEFFFDKRNKNVLLNKFYAKAKVDKDGTNVLNVDISTNQKPYKFYVFLPAILGKLRPGMTEVDVTVDHEKGQYLDMQVKHAGAKFKGFKISRTGNGNEREIVWNGAKLATGDYSLTDTQFSTTQTLANGRHLTTTISWKNKLDSPQFITDNKVSVVLDGSHRKLDLDLEWDMLRIPDFDLSTPERGNFKLNAVGQNERWGAYTINRALSFSAANRKYNVDLTGNSSFGAGPLAAKSPITTEIKFSYDGPKKDLVGKFVKTYAGKEYSITFPRGSFVMPSIKLGA